MANIIDPESLGSAAAVKAAYEQQLNNPPAEEPTVYRRRIQMATGEIEVTAPSPEELIDKVVELNKSSYMVSPEDEQAEVEAQAAQTESERLAARQSEADSEWVLAQEFMTSPSKSLAKALGFDSIEDARAALQAAKDERGATLANQSAEAYVAHHSDPSKEDFFYACPESGRAVQSYMRLYNIACDEAGIHKAVTALREQGLLN
jgi:hypothetical protein